MGCETCTLARLGRVGERSRCSSTGDFILGITRPQNVLHLTVSVPGPLGLAFTVWLPLVVDLGVGLGITPPQNVFHLTVSVPGLGLALAMWLPLVVDLGIALGRSLYKRLVRNIDQYM